MSERGQADGARAFSLISPCPPHKNWVVPHACRVRSRCRAMHRGTCHGRKRGQGAPLGPRAHGPNFKMGCVFRALPTPSALPLSLFLTVRAPGTSSFALVGSSSAPRARGTVVGWCAVMGASPDCAESGRAIFLGAKAPPSGGDTGAEEQAPMRGGVWVRGGTQKRQKRKCASFCSHKTFRLLGSHQPRPSPPTRLAARVFRGLQSHARVTGGRADRKRVQRFLRSAQARSKTKAHCASLSRGKG